MTKTEPLKVISWEPSSWGEAKEIAGDMIGWLFRGHANAQWHLETNIERYADERKSIRDGLYEYEESCVEKFQRHAHLYLQHVPDRNSKLDWLSIIQHHGGATRFLDVTSSFYVATYFAVDSSKTDSAIWAFDSFMLRRNIKTDKTQDGKGPESYVKAQRRIVEQSLGTPKCNSSVVHVEPWWLSERMVIQQSSFLFPLALSSTFEQNLASTLGIKAEQISDPKKLTSVSKVREGIKPPQNAICAVKIIFSQDIRFEIRRDLERMNITSATLFPGLDGFTRSLRNDLVEGYDT